MTRRLVAALTKLFVISLVVLAAANTSSHTAPAAAAPVASIQADIEGEPTTAQSSALQTLDVDATAVPVAGAHITVSALGLAATTGAAGKAVIGGVPISEDITEPTRIDIVVSAPGYATFTYHSAPISRAGLILTPVLNQVARVDDLSGPPTEPIAGPAQPDSASPSAASSTSCSNWTVTSAPPQRHSRIQ
jgi:hypothetical protein